MDAHQVRSAAPSDSPALRTSSSARLGAVLAIETWVAIQFFEVTLVDVGSFPVSVQKIVSVFLFPFALLALRRWLVPKTLVALLVLMVLVNSLWYLTQGAVTDTRMIGADLTAVVTVFGATVLYSALVAVPDGFERLGRAWVRWALVTAPICVLQAINLLPLFNVPPELLANRATGIGLQRAVGFKADPNFQALMLVVGALFATTFVRKRSNRVLQCAVIGIGIVATFSRMGLVLFALVLFAGPLGRAFTAGGVGRVLLRSVLIGAALVGVGVAAFLQGLLPHVVQSYFADRFLEAWRALASFSITGSGVGVRTGELGSAATRLLLAAGALRLFLANPWVGIGAGRSKDLLVAATGVLNVAHNSYLEMAMTGGLAGIAFLVAYFLPATRRSHGAPGQGGDLRALRACSVALYAVFGLVFLFLSLQANSILYIPVVVALALDRRSGEPELTVGSA